MALASGIFSAALGQWNQTLPRASERVVLLLLANAASACSCSLPSLDEAMSNADVVFRGTVVAVKPSPSHPLLEPVETTIVVREVWKGTLGERVTLRSGSLCAVQSLPEDTEWIVFARGGAEGIVISYCSGSEEVGKATLAGLTDIFGGPPPVPVSEQLGPGRSPG